MSLAYIFPGQGSQSVGMLNDLSNTYPQIISLFKQASEILSQDLWDICQNNSNDELNKTEFTQPIMLIADIALWQISVQKNNHQPIVLAGHSLGEYAALVAAEALSFEDAVKVVNLRGKFMQDAVPYGTGAMAAILGLSKDAIQNILDSIHKTKTHVVQAVNLNTPMQTVIAGHKAAVEQANEALKENGAKRAIMLPVSVPSHCELMLEAAQRLEEVLTSLKIVKPNIPVIHNVDVKMHPHPDDIRIALVKQLFQPVRWVETIESLIKEDVDTFIECGPGKVLTQLNKKIAKDITAKSIHIAL